MNLKASVSKRKLFITDIRGQGNPSLLAATELVKRYGLNRFESAKTAEQANIVLYIESGYLGLSDLTRLLRRIRAAKSAMHFIFSETDWPFPVLPGAYPSLPRPCSWAHSWCFLPNISLANSEAVWAEPEFLFSFLGRVATHAVRRTIRTLDGASTPCLDVEEAPQRFPGFDFWKTYAQLLQRSKFVLCPRGFGASSIRIFEAMSFGRVPVIISDAWQPPPAIPWQEFSIVIPERNAWDIPVLLENLESQARSMGQVAWKVFDENFSPYIFLDKLVTSLISNYENFPLTTRAICWRALRAAGWREIWTICHRIQHWNIDGR